MLISLPVEVQKHIISLIPTNRDIAALSRSCGHLNSLCDMETRKSFHRIKVTASDEDLDSVFSLILSILKKPRLGDFINHIECPVPAVIPFEDWALVEAERELTDREMDLVRSAVDKGGFGGLQGERVVNMLMQKSVRYVSGSLPHGMSREYSWRTFITQALVSVLVTVSPYLQSLAITQPFGHHTGGAFGMPLDSLLRRANSSLETIPYLRHLCKVYFINLDEYDEERYYIPMDFNACLSLFENLPSIQYAGIDALEENDMDLLFSTPKTSNISRISILHSAVDSTYLVGVMSSCKSLREFRYSVGGRATNDGSTPWFNLKVIIKGLCRHKQALEILDIDAEAECSVFRYDNGEDMEPGMKYGYPFGREPEDVYAHEPIRSVWSESGSLEDFVALKSLSLGIKSLLYFAKGVDIEICQRRPLVDCLPPGLEHICVRGYERGAEKEHDEQMDALITLYESGSSTLKRVEGIEEPIPNACWLEDPDEDEHLLWTYPDS